MNDIKSTTSWANELLTQFNAGDVNSQDIAAARWEAEDANARSMAAYGHTGGLVAAPAGTWTPSMGWYSNVKAMRNIVESYKNKKPDGVDTEEWTAALAELDELSEKLTSIVDGK